MRIAHVSDPEFPLQIAPQSVSSIFSPDNSGGSQETTLQYRNAEANQHTHPIHGAKRIYTYSNTSIIIVNTIHSTHVVDLRSTTIAVRANGPPVPDARIRGGRTERKATKFEAGGRHARPAVATRPRERARRHADSEAAPGGAEESRFGGDGQES